MLLATYLISVPAFPLVTWGFYNSTLETQYLRAVLTQDDLAARICLAVFGNIFSCHNWWVVAVTGIYWADAKNADMYLQCMGQPLTT